VLVNNVGGYWNTRHVTDGLESLAMSDRRVCRLGHLKSRRRYVNFGCHECI
jgi:hypothetical protein